MFKVITAGDPIDAEKKNQNSFSFPPSTKLVYSANLPPLPPIDMEEEDAFCKRWFVESFNFRAGKKCLFNKRRTYCLIKDKCPIYATSKGGLERDPNVLEKIIADEEEMPGLLYLAVKALCVC